MQFLPNASRMLRVAIVAIAVQILSTAAVSADGEVNVYSSRQGFLIEPLLEQFEAETGIKVNLLSLQDGLVERIKLEDELSPADVIMTVDIGRLASAVSEGVTQPVVDAEVNANVPETLRDPDGDWIGLTTRARIVYASKERVADGEVATYEDLANPRWKGRICTRSGRHRYNLALISAFIEHKGVEAAEAWLRGVKANLARRPQGNDRAQVKAIWAGECDISIGNTYYMGKMLSDPEQRAWAESVTVEFPVFEGGGTHVNISGTAMARHSPNPENALKLIRFLASETAQRIYAEINYEYPVKPGVPISATVAEWGSFEPDPIRLADIAERRAEALRIVDRVAFDD